MIFLHWLQDNGWISARMSQWRIAKVEKKLNHTFFEENEEDEQKVAAAKRRKSVVEQPLLFPHFFSPLLVHACPQSPLSPPRPSLSFQMDILANWTEEVVSPGDIDTKTRAAFGFSEYVTGTVSWLLGVEQILYNVGHVTDADGKDKDIYRYYGVPGKEGQMTSHRWVFDGKGACLDRIGDKVLGAGICRWLSLALDGVNSKQVFHPPDHLPGPFL